MLQINSSIFFRILCLCFTLFCLSTITPAYLSAQKVAPDSSVIRSVTFKGNYNVSEATLENLVRTRTNREFMEIPYLTIRYWLWKTNHRWGEPPQLLSREKVARDMEVISLYYQSLGFFEVDVDTTITALNKNRCRVAFNISEGTPSKIDTVFYRGLPHNLDTLAVKKFITQSELKSTIITDTSYVSDQNFTETRLDAERKRIITFLRNNGYASVRQDSVIARVRRSSEPYYRDVLFDVSPGTKYRFGDLRVTLNTPNESSLRQTRIITDTTLTEHKKKVVLNKNDATQTKFNLLKDQIVLKPGAEYNDEQFNQTVKRYQRLGMITVLGYGLGQEARSHSFDSLYVPLFINLQTLPKHQISTEWFGMQRFGYGAGTGITYTNNNTFGGAEALKLTFNGSFEYLSDSSYERLQEVDSLTTRVKDSRVLKSLETSLSYTVPKLLFPFNALPNKKSFYDARTQYSVTYSQANQINFDINLELRLNWRFEIQHSPTRYSFIDLAELEWLDTTPNDRFNEQLEILFPDPVARKLAKEDFRPQFTSIFRYTYRNAKTDLIKRDFGHFTEASIAFAGNLPYLIDRYLVTPSKLENSLPSLFGLSGNRVDYSQFVKLTWDYRRYIPLDPERRSIVAYRLYAGYIHPYGKNKEVPINRRFFAGGNSDIRGYNIFRLGPGALPYDQVTKNGGEIKLASFVELRQRFIENFISANWYSVLFTDMGNIWYGPRNKFDTADQNELLAPGKFKLNSFYKQIPVVSGLGLRLDWDFLVLRFDLAFRFHDVQQGWFQKSKPYFSFGIGHSF